MKTTFTGEVDMPDGYEFVAWRVAGVNDEFLHEGRVLTCCCRTPAEVVIVRKVEQWRDATIDDLKRAPCEARFRDKPDQIWSKPLMLSGYRAYSCIASHIAWVDKAGTHWDECQVKDA